MQIAVAICTWNRCALLRQTLESLTALRIPSGVDWEVLVVNNNCTDATDDVVASFTSRLPIRRAFEATPGVSHARNRALAETQADYILFTDDDVVVDRGWLAAFVDAARRAPHAAAFFGPVEPSFPIPADPRLVDAFPELKRGFCGIKLDLQEGPLPDDLISAVYGVNMAFRKAAVDDLCFDTGLGPNPLEPGRAGEDGAFLARIRRGGGTVVWCPRMMLKHYVDPTRMTLDYLLRFSSDRGRTLIRREGPSDSVTLFGVPRWIWRHLAQERIKYALLALTPYRTASLRALRECWRLKGMIAECRALQKEEAAARAEVEQRATQVARASRP
jgi:glycosyltransferase involved in cell wall biosynthesis